MQMESIKATQSKENIETIESLRNTFRKSMLKENSNISQKDTFIGNAYKKLNNDEKSIRMSDFESSYNENLEFCAMSNFESPRENKIRNSNL